MWCFIGLPTFAQVQPPSDQSAQTLFDAGRLLLKQRRFDEACAAFEKSQALAPALGTLLNLADCNEQRGRLASAYRDFTGAAAWARRHSHVPREQLASERAAALRAKLSWLHLSWPTGAQVTLDRRPLQGPGEVPVDSGVHELESTREGATPWRLTVLVPSGPSVQQISVPELTPTPSAVASPMDAPLATGKLSLPAATLSTPAEPALVAPLEQPRRSRVGPAVTIGVGGAMLAAGVAGIAYTLSTRAAVEDQQPGRPDALTPTVTRSEYERLATVYPVSVAGSAVGAAAVAVGLFWLWSIP